MSDLQPEPLLLLERRGDVLLVTINRPRKGNALSVGVLDALDDVVSRLRASDGEFSEVRAVIVTGAGAKVFSAGADINNLLGLGADAAEAQMVRGQAVFSALEDLPQVVIAAINGIAYGGGLELAMACDLRVAAPGALLGQPEITLANLPGWAGTQRLPRLIGEGRALELILTGEPISAGRALDLGLVNRVAENPIDDALDLASRITVHAAGAVAAAKTAVYTGVRDGIRAGSRREAELVGVRCISPEQRSAVESFLNRKKPNPTD